MLDSVKIARRQSEIRQSLAGIVGKDKPSDDETRQMETLDGEYRSNETRYRAALISEDTERREAGADLDTRDGRAWSDLVAGFALVPDGADADGPQPLGRMKDLVRGGDAQFESFAETQLTWDEGSDGLWRESAATGAATVAFQKAVQNALALVRVNPSLSILRAFGRFYDLRHAKDGPMWKAGE